MKGDFSRSTFDPKKHFSSVRMQQGRVQLDADWNEQVDILRHLQTSQISDIVGTTGGPADGFKITVGSNGEDNTHENRGESSGSEFESMGIQIAPGHYYVAGILCENDAQGRIDFASQPDLPHTLVAEEQAVLQNSDQALVYLDVWQRHVTMVEDPALKEVALGGADTTTRTKTIWQVRLLPIAEGDNADETWENFTQKRSRRGCLRAKPKAGGTVLQNQLHRVEVHTVHNGRTILKWAADNASTVWPVTSVEAQESDQDRKLILKLGLAFDVYPDVGEGDWVELVTDSISLGSRPWPMAKMKDVNRQHGNVTIEFQDLASTDRAALISTDWEALNTAIAEEHVLLRRWDGSAEAIDLKSNESELPAWMSIADSIEVALTAPDDSDQPLTPGDYWWIPARTKLESKGDRHGNVDWPDNAALPPHGIEHRFACLARLYRDDGRWRVEDKRPQVYPITDLGSMIVDNHAQIADTVADHRAQIQTRLDALEDKLDQLAWRPSYHSSCSVEKGCVVAFEPHGEPLNLSERWVKPADEENAALLVGVVLDANGLEPDSLAAEPAGAVTRCRLAQSGEALCRVVGTVKPGDLLTPSSTPGYAQAAGLYVRSGTVIGKALTGFRPDSASADDAKGMVRMLVLLA